ncbi:hypothetical protein [Pseudomonas sp. NFR16]|uniref:hypothetical protein n=1 Tax=Pseudomonas sp. NFR16 TaxID=1566248 RepID=UPI0008AFC974|nr:hypothetical protein [Pseudomonas sp. NFR16]SEJ07077.1 hypothetical protein SAMN03159495_2200 [Pseudomonas sp. NFR16]
MKKSIALGFALSVLAATSAFASPQASTAGQTIVLEPTYIHATAINADGADKTGVKPFASPSTNTVIVADNRKEFGSQYQRY